MQHQERVGVANEIGRFRLAFRIRNDVENRRGGKMRDQFASIGTVIFVDNRSRHLVDVEGRGVSEQQQLDDGRADQDRAPTRVFKQHQKFFPDESKYLGHRVTPVPYG